MGRASRIDSAVECIGRRIGQGQRVFEGRSLEDCEDRPEDFLLGYSMHRRDLSKNRRPHIPPWLCDSPFHKQTCFLLSYVDIFLNIKLSLVINNWHDIISRFFWVSNQYVNNVFF